MAATSRASRRIPLCSRARASRLAGRALRGLLWCCILLPVVTAAQPRRDQDEEEGEKKSWTELEIKLPPLPKPENLLQFEPSAASGNRYYIDATSILIGDDGAVRYTLVIRSPSGVDNISYEGIRCDTVEQKYYAFGRRDGTWSPSRSSVWRLIEYKELNRQHGVLYSSYFCPDGSPILSAKDAINRFKYGVPYGAPPRSGNRR